MDGFRKIWKGSEEQVKYTIINNNMVIRLIFQTVIYRR